VVKLLIEEKSEFFRHFLSNRDWRRGGPMTLLYCESMRGVAMRSQKVAPKQNGLALSVTRIARFFLAQHTKT
jgi:hypothetical protein